MDTQWEKIFRLEEEIFTGNLTPLRDFVMFLEARRIPIGNHPLMSICNDIEHRFVGPGMMGTPVERNKGWELLHEWARDYPLPSS